MKFFLFSLLFLVVSCGSSPDERRAPGERYIDSSTGKPIKLLPATYVCKNDSGEYAYELKFEKLPLTTYELVSNNPASESDIVSRVLFGGEINYKLEVKSKRGGVARGKYSHEIVKPLKPVNLCPNHIYQERSYENVALKVQFAIDNAYNNLKNSLPKINPVELNIGTIVNHIQVVRENNRVTHNKRTLVNNAIYSAQEKAITFLLPGMNDEGLTPFNGLVLWDIPLVAAHELGHHIFSEITKDNMGRYTRHSGPCFDNRNVSPGLKKLNEKRKVSNFHILKVLDESVADLFAFYGLDKKYHNLRVMPCLAFNREVNASVFFNSEEKVLSHTVMDTFLSEEPKEIQSCITQVDYQDEHIIGAIMANIVHQLMDQVNMERPVRVKTIISWLNAIRSEISSIKKMDNKKALVTLLNLFKIQIDQSDPSQTIKVCELMLKRAPIFQDYYSCN